MLPALVRIPHYCSLSRISEANTGTLSPDIYCASRSLHGLAKDGQAPKIFAKTLQNGNPIWAVGFSSCFVALAFMNASKSASTVFQYFVSLVTIFAVLNWIAILVSHISFRKALKVQGIELAQLPYVGPLQPYGSYFALFVSILVVIFNGKASPIPQKCQQHGCANTKCDLLRL